MVRIKICGIKTEEHGLAAADSGADFIGLVFAPSPRRVTVEQALRIVRAVKDGARQTELVGVFVNESAAEINRIAAACRLDRVQLSGDEPRDYHRLIERPVIRTLRISSNGPEILEDIDGLVYLLDAHVEGKYGGTGRAFDWNIAKQISRQARVILAGGLTPENVSQAVTEVMPWGVDVSSGVESGGIKDLAKIRVFIANARRASDYKT